MCHGAVMRDGWAREEKPGENVSFVVEREKEKKNQKTELLICLFGFGWCCTVIWEEQFVYTHWDMPAR